MIAIDLLAFTQTLLLHGTRWPAPNPTRFATGCCTLPPA